MYTHKMTQSIRFLKKSAKFDFLLGFTFGATVVSLISIPTAFSIVSFLLCNISIISSGCDGSGACPFTAGKSTANSTFKVFSLTKEVPGITMSEG